MINGFVIDRLGLGTQFKKIVIAQQSVGEFRPDFDARLVAYRLFKPYPDFRLGAAAVLRSVKLGWRVRVELEAA